MAQLLVRQLDDDAKERLKARAERNGRSLEAEAREILEAAAEHERTRRRSTPGFGTRMRDASRASVSRNRSWQSSIGVIDKARKERVRFVKFKP